MTSWKTFLARTAAASVMGSAALTLAVFAGIRLANADPGGPITPSGLTYAGVLRTSAGTPYVGAATLQFALRKGSTTTPACTVNVTANVTAAAAGAFSVAVPLDTCPRDLFDGSTVSYDVTLVGDGTVLAQNVPITAVPYARFADQVGVSNDCPAGYTVDSSAAPTILCVRPLGVGRDEVVKVGRDATAFWVDRYEATVIQRSNGARTTTINARLAITGQWATPEARSALLAASRAGEVAAQNVTWFQASELCNAAGKRLMTRREWFAAASGLTAIETAPGSGCATGTTTTRNTGLGAMCESIWGAQDMVGNLWEWTDEWYTGAGILSGTLSATPNQWPTLAYGDDGLWSLNSRVFSEGTGASSQFNAVPAAALRGGATGVGTRAGVFAMNLLHAPSQRDPTFGFRCVIPR